MGNDGVIAQKTDYKNFV